jgi:Fe-S-cluster-containing hydrogenase component 2
MANPQAKTLTVEAFRAHPTFRLLDAQAIEHVLHHGRIVEVARQQRLSEVVRPSLGEDYCFVLSGEITVVVDPVNDNAGCDREHVGWFGPGELFSDGYLTVGGAGQETRLDCVASTPATLLAMEATALVTIMRQHPTWAAQLNQTMVASRQRFLLHREPARRLVQDFFLRQNYRASQRIRVSETSLCFECDKCEAACARRHGQSRMSRVHVRLGRLAFQQFCLNCSDQACLKACSVGAIRSEAGELRITQACNGCGACVRKCPHGAIRILDVPYTTADFPAPVPSVGEAGATSVAGLRVAGEVTGPCSIKAALHDARRAVDAIPASSGVGDARLLDVIVVGAGVAGMAAATRCVERQLRVVVLEKSASLTGKATRAAPSLAIRPGEEVLGLAALGDGRLRVDVSAGSYLARNVVVCTGALEPGRPSLLGKAGITLIQPGSSEMAALASRRGNHAKASKCDNCAGYADRACIRACPTGSLIELRPDDLFFEPAPDGRSGQVLSSVAFVEGASEQRARRRKHRTLATALSVTVVLALVAIGIECFLRRALPEHSVFGVARRWAGNAYPIWYSSGKGFGHWLGYVGTGFMLSTLLYPLRTRCGVLRNWGAQSSWLTVHLWVGFIGATLVTYHAAFKLDRWVALACYAMWTVVLSGAVGRYLYGMVHSGIGLVDLEREALGRNSMRETARASVRGSAVKLIAPDVTKAGSIFVEVWVMLWEELRDFVLLLWLRVAGLSHIPDRRQRRETVQYLADVASHRRARRYLESAKRLLRYWNWVHILLTITMFVLAGFHITYGFMYKAV